MRLSPCPLSRVGNLGLPAGSGNIGVTHINRRLQNPFLLLADNLIIWVWSGKWIRTTDLRLMGPSRCRCAIPPYCPPLPGRARKPTLIPVLRRYAPPVAVYAPQMGAVVLRLCQPAPPFRYCWRWLAVAGILRHRSTRRYQATLARLVGLSGGLSFSCLSYPLLASATLKQAGE